MRSLTVFCTTSLVAAVLAAVPGASAATPTCHGLPATVQSDGAGNFAGTEGDDVIVADKAKSVYALGGDDLICLTGSSFPVVEAGGGNDTVDATGALQGSKTELGEGDDRYLGSAAEDVVYAGTYTGGLVPHEDTGHDVISTGPKGDIQDTVYSGQPGQSNADEVRGGWMALIWSGHATGTGVMDGGAHSQLRLNTTDTEGLSIYNDLGKLATRGQPLQDILRLHRLHGDRPQGPAAIVVHRQRPGRKAPHHRAPEGDEVPAHLPPWRRPAQDPLLWQD